MKTYTYILLDWDGNLAKTLDVWLDAYRITFKKHSVDVSDEEITDHFGDIPSFLRELGVQDVGAMYEEAHVLARQGLPDAELYPDVLAVLKTLHVAGKQLALITSSPHRNIQTLLEKYSLKPFFGVIVAGDDVTHTKPNPEPFEKALAALGGTKSEAIMIGDSSIDVEGANNAGIDSILFHTPDHGRFFKLEALQALKPTHVIDDFRQILELV